MTVGEALTKILEFPAAFVWTLVGAIGTAIVGSFTLGWWWAKDTAHDALRVADLNERHERKRVAELQERLGTAAANIANRDQTIRELREQVLKAEQDADRCPAGRMLTCRCSNEVDGKPLRRYWTTTCGACPLKSKCTTGPECRISRWVHEHVLEAVQERFDRNPDAMRTRREVVEHPFGRLKMSMGATHVLMKTLPKVATEMALCVLGYHLTRVINIVGVEKMMEAARA